jgi:tRNA G37 N-methylase Trm5
MYRLALAMVVAIGLLMPAMPTPTMGQDGKDAPAKNKEAPAKKLRKPDVIYVPTPPEVVEKMLDMAKVKKGDVVYDLGCGDGRIVVAAAKRGATATGWDIDPERIKEAEANVKQNKVEKNAKIICGDIFTLDLSKANVVTLYLLPSLNVKLIPQLEKLKPGSRIVSHDFDMEGVKPEQVEQVTSEEEDGHTVYLWTTPLKKEK